MTKNGDWYAKELSNEIQRDGPEFTTRVILDSAGECVVARREVKKKYPHVDVAACAEHCLDLLLDDIGKIPRFKKMIETSKVMAKAFNDKDVAFEYAEQGGTQLDKFCGTRMGSTTLSLESIKKNKGKMINTACSERFHVFASKKHRRQDDFDPMNDTVAKGKTNEAIAKIVRDALKDDSYWDEAELYLAITNPIYRCLRFTDTAKQGTTGLHPLPPASIITAHAMQ